MEESATTKNENKVKSILRPKTSKGEILPKAKKHLNIKDNNDNYLKKIEKNPKPENLFFSKFDFNKDYMKNERKEFSIKLKNLNKINLLENKIDDLYKWENLFNNFKPISSYVSLKKPINNEESKKEINFNKEYESPILLVDLPETQMNLFFRSRNIHNFNSLSQEKNKNFNNKNSNIRLSSMYSPREENSCFYYSNTFSDYYKEDFKSFCSKIPILKAKLKIKSGKLRKEIYQNNDKLINKFKILEEKRKDKTTKFNKQHLIIAGERKNPNPLLKSVFLQKYYPENKFEENQKFFNNINNNSNELNNNYGYKIKNHLLLSYYDVNDPLLALFNNKRNSDITNNIYYSNFNNTTNNIKVYQVNEVPLKKDKEIQKIKYDSKNQQKKKKSKSSHFKVNLGLLDKNIGVYNDKQQINTTNLKARYNTTNKNIKLPLNNDNIIKEYKSPNSFPLKTSSNVGNISYNKIKRFIKEKQFLNKFNINYNSNPRTKSTLKSDKTSTDKSDLELIWNSKKIKPKKNDSLFYSLYDKKFGKKSYYQWDKGGNLINNKINKKCNVIYFHKCIKTKLNKELAELKLSKDNNCFSPINAFNKGYVEHYKMKNKKIFGNKKDKENDKDFNNIKSKDNLNDQFFVFDFLLDEQ